MKEPLLFSTSPVSIPDHSPSSSCCSATLSLDENLVRPSDEEQQPMMRHQFNYREVQLFKTETLGRGAYGVVCRAKCDELPCAAKLLHSIFLGINDPGQSLTLVRTFNRECRLLSSVRHPCIVQYLGTYQDPESRQPVLLMELMDQSLTHFLERRNSSVPFHIQVNILHDVALALVYLHTNGIIHRDLSSNNVLLIGESRAKVTDFGMSKLVDVVPRNGMTPLTQCPGTLVYMSPEALRDPPVYTMKLDVFSAGVLIIQTVTRKFPHPANAKETRYDTQYGTVEVPIPEQDRRRSDIDLIDPANPLLPIALACLSDREADRPIAARLCQDLASLKTTERYERSTQLFMERVETLEQTLEEKEVVLAEKDAIIETLARELEEASRRVEQLQQSRDLTMSLAYNDLPPDADDDTEKQLHLDDTPSPDLWFHGRITRALACRRLEEIGQPGAYLVRESNAEIGNFVLSFLGGGGRIHHFKISCIRGRYNIGGPMWFSSLQNLVGYHRKYSSVVENQSERLDIPVAPPQVVNLLGYQQ